MDRDKQRAGRRERGTEDLREEREHGKEGLRDEEELRVQRTEEELRSGTREREAGEVRVRKDVRPGREQVRVPTRHEEVSVERVPVEEGRYATPGEIGDDEITMPVVEEEVLTEKRPVVKEEIRIRKDAVQDEEVVEEGVRREEVDVEDATATRGWRGGGEEKGKRPRVPSQKDGRRKSARGEKRRAETKTS